ncbi:La-related protein 1c [Thalictrum thalictroides]|uniref:La-related protein 1c n=1 Tax=Thalictrum thalictroides TaxID=46969 RepID=A0A7J6X3Y2_THATH|nr:La-related protein 1c [Thalictrum thalictroides]
MATISSSDTIVAVLPRSSSKENLTSPQNRKNNHKNLSSPWSNIVRGESESVPAAAPSSPLSSSVTATMIEQTPDSVVSSSPSLEISIAEALPPDISDGGNSNAAAAAKSKKPAWNKPSNGPAVEVSPVMGAVCWPALSDSAKVSPKSSSESLKTLSDGSASASQGPVVASSLQKALNSSANPNSTTNHQFPVRQKSFKRGGGSANGGSSQPKSHPSATAVVEAQNNSSKNISVVHGTSPRDPPHKGNNWEGGQRTGTMSQPHTGNDHQQRNSFRRGGGGHHRGDGSNHFSHGNRRDLDGANHDLNLPHRVFNGRDGNMQPRVNPRNFLRSMQPSTPPFVSTPPVRPFGNTLGFPDIAPQVIFVPASHEPLRGVPFFHGTSYMILPGPGPDPVRAALTKQIEYYFSPENLCKDIYLRKFMDVQGWVPLSVIADFNRVKQFANNNIPLIVESVRNSTIVEVQDDKIRKRNDWMNWTLLPGQSASASDPLSPGATQDMLANCIRSVGLVEESTGNGKNPADAHPQAVLTNSSTESLNDHTKALNGEGQNILQ